jgi:hypothetical protein
LTGWVNTAVEFLDILLRIRIPSDQKLVWYRQFSRRKRPHDPQRLGTTRTVCVDMSGRYLTESLADNIRERGTPSKAFRVADQGIGIDAASDGNGDIEKVEFHDIKLRKRLQQFD